MKEQKYHGTEDIAVKTVSLAKMKQGQIGKIVEINGDQNLVSKLHALGITIGKNIEKVSGQLLKGPILLRHNHTQAAIGFTMASKILLQVKVDH